MDERTVLALTPWQRWPPAVSILSLRGNFLFASRHSETPLVEHPVYFGCNALRPPALCSPALCTFRVRVQGRNPFSYPPSTDPPITTYHPPLTMIH